MPSISVKTYSDMSRIKTVPSRFKPLSGMIRLSLNSIIRFRDFAHIPERIPPIPGIVIRASTSLVPDRDVTSRIMSDRDVIDRDVAHRDMTMYDVVRSGMTMLEMAGFRDRPNLPSIPDFKTPIKNSHRLPRTKLPSIPRSSNLPLILNVITCREKYILEKCYWDMVKKMDIADKGFKQNVITLK